MRKRRKILLRLRREKCTSCYLKAKNTQLVVYYLPHLHHIVYLTDPSTHHACSSSTIRSLAHHTTYWSTLTSSTFPSRLSWMFFSPWWIAFMPNVNYLALFINYVHYFFSSVIFHQRTHYMSYVYFVGIPYITDCVMAEIEKLGLKYRVALRYKILLARYISNSSSVIYNLFIYNNVMCICFLQNSQGPQVWAPTVHTQRNICWWLLGSTGNPGNYHWTNHFTEMKTLFKSLITAFRELW